ncbi:MAG: hypothetical protein AAF633_13020 [Chloroflexota bacterium]
MVLLIAGGWFDPWSDREDGKLLLEEPIFIPKNSYSQIGVFDLTNPHATLTLETKQPSDGILSADWPESGLQINFYPSGFLEVWQGETLLHPLQDFPHIQLVETGGINQIDIRQSNSATQEVEVWINREIAFSGCSACMKGKLDVSLSSYTTLYEGIIKITN